MPMKRRTLISSFPIITSLAVAGRSFAKTGPAVSVDPDTSLAGVCSGDPSAESVVLWADIPPHLRGSTLELWLGSSPDTLSLSEFFDGPSCVNGAGAIKVVCGNLNPGSTLCFQFQVANEWQSPLGVARTLPHEADPRPIGLAYISCMDFTSGYYNVLQSLARDSHVEFCVHLGDAIYERGSTSLLSVRHDTVGGGEALSLNDYREKHRLYLGDTNYQEARRRKTWIYLPDDHEVVDNYHRETNHHRRQAAMQAYHEFMPTRVGALASGGSRLGEKPPSAWLEPHHRSFVFGSHSVLHTLDSRQFRNPHPCSRSLIAPLCDEALAPGHTMLGGEQKSWLEEQMQGLSSGRNCLVASPVVMMPLRVLHLPREVFDPFVGELPGPFQASGKGTELSFTLDAWDGFPTEREWLMALMQEQGKSLVISGDSHNQYVGRCERRGQHAAWEVSVGSVSSKGVGDYLRGQSHTLVEQLFRTQNRHLTHTDLKHHMYVRLRLHVEGIDMETRSVSAVRHHHFRTKTTHSERLQL